MSPCLTSITSTRAKWKAHWCLWMKIIIQFLQFCLVTPVKITHFIFKYVIWWAVKCLHCKQHTHKELIYSNMYILCRSEGSKTSVPFINKQDRQYNVPVSAAPHCCIDAEQDRRSPTGRAETHPDTSKLNIDITRPFFDLFMYNV